MGDLPSLAGMKQRPQLLAGQKKNQVSITGGNIANVVITNSSFEGDIPALRTDYFASVKDYGAVGNGVTNDAPAFAAAFAANYSVYVPEGTYLISSTVEVPFGRRLWGAGVASVIQATGNSYDVLKVPNGYTHISDLLIQNGDAGVRYFGRDGSCVESCLNNVLLSDQNNGIVLDGYTDTAKPCYWNSFTDIFIRRPKTNGILLTKTGAGDSPNTNYFTNIKIRSLSSPITGAGIYVQYGAFNNEFTRCAVDLDITAGSCIRIGANSNKTILNSPYTETDGAVINILLDSGSLDTAIYNELSVSAGAAIQDNSGGNYRSYNSGSPVKNYLQNTNWGHPLQVVQNTLTPYIQLHGTDSNGANSAIYRYSANNVGARINLGKSRGVTIGTQGVVLNNDDLGYVDFNGSDNNSIRASSQVKGTVDAVVTAGTGIVPGRVVVSTVNAAGTLTEAYRFDSKGNAVIGTAALATTATDGFNYISTSAGPPTGVPTTYTGRTPVHVDTTNNAFYFYSTGAWRTSSALATPVSGANGGTGVNNGVRTLNMAGNLTFAGSFTQTFTATANTSVTLPTTGTLATLAGSEVFTNKTINGSGSGNTLSNTFTLTTTGSSGAATYNGTTLNVPQYSGGFTQVKYQIFTTSGTYTPTAGMKYVNVKVIGGGGGGGTASASNNAIAGGGQAGSFAESIIVAATVGASQSITIGTGGAAATAGTASSFGALVVAGGGDPGGSSASASAQQATLGGYLGTATTGNILVNGESGGFGVTMAAAIHVSGKGGDTIYGTGGAPVLNAAGNNATGYGGGGGGGGGTTGTGGTGSGGIVVVTEYI